MSKVNEIIKMTTKELGELLNKTNPPPEKEKMSNKKLSVMIGTDYRLNDTFLSFTDKEARKSIFCPMQRDTNLEPFLGGNISIHTIKCLKDFLNEFLEREKDDS